MVASRGKCPPAPDEEDAFSMKDNFGVFAPDLASHLRELKLAVPVRRNSLDELTLECQN